MSRKSVELVVLLALSSLVTFFDPLKLTKDFAPRETIFACVIYAFPAALVALALSRLLYGFKSKPASPAEPSEE